MIKKLYIDGDSFSCMGVKRNFGDILAERLGLDLEHFGYVGRAPNTIIRTATRYCFNDLHKDAFMCIGIGAEMRSEYISTRKVFNPGRKIMPEEEYTSNASEISCWYLSR